MALYNAIYTLFVLAGCVEAMTLVTHAEQQSSQHIDAAFSEFIATHNRDYPSHEHGMRRDLFHMRWNAIEHFNSQPDRLWTAGINEFADRTEAERHAVLGYDHSSKKSSSSASMLQVDDMDYKDLPETINWKNLTVAKNVRNQGGCGSCWAFATIAVMEAHYEIHVAKGGPVRQFSPQQVVSCAPNPHSCGGSGGCEGATVELGLDWIMKNGLASESDVPYFARTGQCKKAHQDGSGTGTKMLTEEESTQQSATGAAVGLVGYHTLPANQDLPLAHALANYGPVGVAVAASEWFMYSRGVFNGCKPGGTINHAVTAYGYGTDAGTKYWLIRNSYGKHWGENGYIRLKRFGDVPKKDQHCGQDTDPMEGVMCKGSKQSSVEVCGMCGVLYDSTVPYFKGSPGPYEQGSAEPFPQSGLGGDSSPKEESLAENAKKPTKFIMRSEQKAARKA